MMQWLAVHVVLLALLLAARPGQGAGLASTVAVRPLNFGHRPPASEPLIQDRAARGTVGVRFEHEAIAARCPEGPETCLGYLAWDPSSTRKSAASASEVAEALLGADLSALWEGDGYTWIPLPHGGGVAVLATTDTGLLYGMCDLFRHAEGKGATWLAEVEAESVAPRFEYRAIKFNLPWSIYAKGNATDQHFATVQDLGFWKRFLDMMVDNKFNVLSLWALHPWPYMVVPTRFPKACGVNASEFPKWQALHRGIFAMAKARGIDTYMVDWNVFVTEQYKDSYDPTAPSDQGRSGGQGSKSSTVREYNREVLTQVINEYPDLTGIGVSLGEDMHSFNLTEQVEWVEAVVLDGIKAANRTTKLIYRAAFGESVHHDNDPTIVRKSIERSGLKDIVVQEKFNWSHGHSTTKLVHVHGGGTGAGYWEPPSTVYKVTWMVRNEDFFFFRWGSAQFIRDHIAANGEPYVGGYAVGSERYIPALDYAQLPGSPDVDWEYGFERQWLFYMLWGNLLYDPSTPDSVFADAYTARYPAVANAPVLFWALQNASVVPLSMASQLYSAEDFSLHCEAFLIKDHNPDPDSKFFISITSLMKLRSLDPQLESVADYVAHHNASLTDPLTTAAAVNRSVAQAQSLLASLDPTGSARYEALDIRAWVALGRYYAAKLAAAVHLALYQAGKAGPEAKAEAVTLLLDAQARWKALVQITSTYLRPSLLLLDTGSFSWAEYEPMVQRDIDIARAA